MLKIISLWTIQRVFDSVKPKLGAKAQIVYINCLMHHFKDLEATEENSVAFEISKKDLRFESFPTSFNELSECGLIEIKGHSVLFLNFWDKYIDKKSYNVKTENLFKNISDLSEDLKNSQTLKELCMKTYKISIVEYEKLLTAFTEEQTGLDKQYQNFRDALNHFYNWISKHHKKQISTIPKASSNNILGMQ